MRATYFDGRTAEVQPVDVSIDGEDFVVAGATVNRREPIGAVEIGDVLGSTLRILRLNGGASCEVANNAELHALLTSRGLEPSRVSTWEDSWRVALVALVLVVISIVTGYLYGLPALARSAADRLPYSALNSLSAQIQGVLERTVFSASELPAARKQSLLDRFDALILPGDAKRRLQLNLRGAGNLGANAMALPNGVVFLTDELVQLTNDDRVLIAVIAHEAGHVDKRHGLRQVIQSTVVGVLITWFLGDVSALGAAAPAALLDAKYSRDLEREADAYAVNVLRMNNLPASLLADALELIEKSHGTAKKFEVVTSYLSSHPATEERLNWIRTQ